MENFAWAITDNNVTVRFDNETHIIKRSDSLANQLIEAIKNKDFDKIPNLVSISKRLKNYSEGNFEIKNGEILINGQKIAPVVGKKILNFMNQGLPYLPLVKFAENLQKNPSFRSVTELFSFLERNDHPITENGNFIAYKKVRDNFLDCHSGTIDNSVGKVIEMPRNQVNDNPVVGCSTGLHVSSWNYANNFYGEGILLEVEVNPEHVVSVPLDENFSKIRVCKYKVLGAVKQEPEDKEQLKITNSNYRELYDQQEDDYHDSEDNDDEEYYEDSEPESYDVEDL